MGLLDLFGGKNKSPQELLAAGKYEQALQGFLKVFKKKPSDPQLMNQIADLYRRLEKNEHAVEFYVKMGDHYGKRGFLNKSVAAFKKALSIFPENEEVLVKLAQYNDQVPKYMIDERILAQIRKLKGEDPDQPADPLELTLEGSSMVMMVDGPAPLPSEEEIDLEDDDGNEVVDEAEDKVNELVDSPEKQDDDAVEEIEDEIIDIEESAPTPKQDEPVSFVSHSSMELTAEDLEGSSLEIKPTDLWDESIKFDDTETEKPAAPNQANPLPDTDSSIWEKDIFDSDEPAPEAPPVVEVKDPVDTNLKESAVFKISGNPSASADDDDGMFFSSFDDAIDSLFQPATTTTKPERHEQNKKHWPVFRTLPRQVFLDLIVAMEERSYSKGDVVVRQGDQGRELFLITEGTFEVYVDAKGQKNKVARLESGDFFGEAALLTKRPRNATVVATSPTEVLILEKDQFITLVKQHPTVLEAIQTVNIARLQQNATRFR
ncbi:MAG: cyclic nucleotide-binding domain-containing protein [Acidobacteria bacterium]|nr:cyclic nucleotide-binding domain-containing protein [Acidobacteriota bacterium]